MLKPEHPRDPEFQDALRALAPGLLPGRRVRRAAAAVRARHPGPRLGEPALLGAAVLARRGARCSTRIWAGDEVTGATTFRIVKELDAGPIFGVMTERIRPNDTAGDLLERLAEGGAGLLVATLDGIADGSLEAAGAAGRGRLVRPEDPGRRRPGRLDPAGDRDRPADPRVHAGARRLDDVRRRAAQARTGHGHRPASSSPARVAVGKSRVLVGTGTHAVLLGDVKAFGKRQMPAADWARGVRLESGAGLGDVSGEV